MPELLNFNDICEKVDFKAFLDWQQISYSETREGLKGNNGKFSFVADPSKKLFFAIDDKNVHGSVINFLSKHKGIDLREAAKLIKHQFITPPKEPKRPIPDLELFYTEEVEKLGVSQELSTDFEIGYAKHGIMKGKVAFLIRNEKGEKIGYVGLNKDGSWFFPKGFNRDWVYNLNRACTDYAILVCGLIDVICLSGLGFRFAVALCGGSATDTRISLLIKKFKRIIILSDRDCFALAGRLIGSCFVKVGKISRPIIEHNADEIKAYFK